MTPVLRLFLASTVVTGLLLGFLAVQRAGVENPFELRIFQHLVLFQDFYVGIPFIVVLLAGLLGPVRSLGERAALACGRYPLAVAALVSLALALGAHWVYHAHPLSMDEYALVFQSEIFASGNLTGQFPPELVNWLVPRGVQGKFFKVDLASGAVASAYWPGFSLLLAPFTLAGVPWLLNPLIGGATVLVMHAIGRRLFADAASAGYVVLFTVASSAVTINALSYYAMPAHLLANALYMLLLLSPTPARAALAGVVGSYALVLHNPVPHMLFALPWFLWLLFQPNGRRLAGALVAGYLPLSLLLGFGWPLLVDRLGSPSAGLDAAAPGGLAEAFLVRLSTILQWYFEPSLAMHVMGFAKLWLWAVPGLMTLAALGAWSLRRERGRWVAIAGSALVSYVGYLYIPFDQGHGWGYRYFHSAWLVLPLLAVAALKRRGGDSMQRGAGPAPSGMAGYAAGCAILSLALLTTLQGLQVSQFIERHLARVPDKPRPDGTILIIEPFSGYYNWDLGQNDPFLRNRTWRLVSRNAALDQAMMAHLFPTHVVREKTRHVTVWVPRR